MSWLLIAIPGVALAVYCWPFVFLDRLAWRRTAGPVRLGKVPHWSVEKAHGRWRLCATWSDPARGEQACGVFPFAADNVVETRDQADGALAHAHTTLGALPATLSAPFPFFWIRCVEPRLSRSAAQTVRIGLGTGLALCLAAVAGAFLS